MRRRYQEHASAETVLKSRDPSPSSWSPPLSQTSMRLHNLCWRLRATSRRGQSSTMLSKLITRFMKVAWAACSVSREGHSRTVEATIPLQFADSLIISASVQVMMQSLKISKSSLSCRSPWSTWPGLRSIRRPARPVWVDNFVNHRHIPPKA